MASSAPNGSSSSSTSRVERERAREADPLLHAAGQLVRIMADEALEADQAHEALGALLAFCAAGSFATSSPKATLRRDRQPGKQVELLKHHRARRRRLLHALAGNRNLAARDRLEAVQDAQQRGLAAAARADDRNELAGGDVETDVAQHFERAAGTLECFADVFDLQHMELLPVDAGPCDSEPRAMTLKAMSMLIRKRVRERGRSGKIHLPLARKQPNSPVR